MLIRARVLIRALALIQGNALNTTVTSGIVTPPECLLNVWICTFNVVSVCSMIEATANQF